MTSMLLLLALIARGQSEYYVSNSKGNDKNPGTFEQPLKTISKGVKKLKPGDILTIFGGTYREEVQLKASGKPDKPITIQAYNQDYVEISGLRSIDKKWKLVDKEKNIYSTKINVSDLSDLFIENNFQVFVDKHQMLEARWPNCTYQELLDRNTWAKVTDESEFGTLYSNRLKGAPEDIVGADIYLNIMHQFFSWKREVLAFDPETGSVEYEKDIVIPPMFFKGWYAKNGWKDDYFYIQGKFALLDYPGEYYYDKSSKDLYLIPPKGVNPDEAKVEIKVRNYGLDGQNKNNISIRNITFFGCATRLQNCSNLDIQGVSWLFPTYSVEIKETVRGGKGRMLSTPSTTVAISGQNNTAQDLYMAYSFDGIQFYGKNNVLKNSIFHDICTSGSLYEKAISGGGQGSLITRNTVFRTGNVGMHLGGGGLTCSYNDVYQSGRLSHDVSSIYTANTMATNARITHNWVHDNEAEVGASGIRGDDLTRGLTVDHNVVWNIKRGRAITIKGDLNTAFNNTCWNNYGDVYLPSRPEPRKQFQVERGETFLDAQNQHSFAYNNIGNSHISDKKQMTPLNIGDAKGNYEYPEDLPLMNIDNKDFRIIESARDTLQAYPYPKGTIIPVEMDLEIPYVGLMLPINHFGKLEQPTESECQQLTSTWKRFFN